MRSSKVDGILLCGGKGERAGAGKNKVLCYFGTKTAAELCLDVMSRVCDNMIVVAASEDMEELTKIAEEYGAVVVVGGDTRFESVKNGLKAAKSEYVVIHDAARPFASEELILRCIDSAERYGSGIAACNMPDSVKRVNMGVITGETDRSELFCVQTPQAFRTSEIKSAYAVAEGNFTDDSGVYAKAGFLPRIVLSSSDNKKITYPEDLIAVPQCQRIGSGIDFHRLVEGRPLILGGVHIPYSKGLMGNSDADVLTHAVMDALLSAADLPDIGVLFPCTDEFAGADSMELLKIVLGKISEYKIESISAVIMAQKPRLTQYIREIRSRLAEALGLPISAVNVSATTTEGMGIIGSEEGMAASAVCLTNKRKQTV